MRIELMGTRGNAVRRANADGTHDDGGRVRGKISKLTTGTHFVQLCRFSESLNAQAYAPGSTKGAA